ncbi:hypothetical protein NLU13_3047 [Sarocladium strictum]|uniref:PHD-type domain-containing protein n=1 Tax=Sarocladium strictum TaxID=5046 RepID=A0AA39GNZ1_SARSR|nr:hypothetical protein NLU13_3047 [Sarocladium strictum]
MMASNTRATRSRYSSPAQPQSHLNGSLETPKGSVAETSRSFMAKWLEPTVQKKASYEEAGLVRQGVLEGMAPLGALPKGKKPSGDGHSGVRKIILRPSGGNASAAPSPRESAPTLAPNLPAAPSSTSPPPPPLLASLSAPSSPQRRKVPAPPKDDEDDGDYDPKPTGSRRRQSGRVTKGKKPLPPTAPQPTASPAEPPVSVDPEVKEFADKVVEAAVDEALQHYRFPTAYALRTLYDERSVEPGFVAMIEDVFSQTADADTVSDFASLLEEKKREGKKGNIGASYFAPTSPSKRNTPWKPKPAPYAKKPKKQNSDADEQEATTTPRAVKKIKIRHSRTFSKSNHLNDTTDEAEATATSTAAPKIQTPSSHKRNRRASGTPPKEEPEAQASSHDDGGLWDRKWEARRVTENYEAQHSFLRGSSPDEKVTPTVKTRRTRQSLLPSVGMRATRSASKRPNDDIDDTISPTAPSWNGDASSTVESRAVTPSSLRPAAKKAKTGIRIKLSPIKKKGAAGGLPRPLSEPQPASNGATREQTADNDEYCSACGNAGDVLCCDGCPRSFHFECVDMTQDELPDEWFCNECLFSRFPRQVPVHRGVFGGALNNLEKGNPRAFSLPKKLQNRFEGVKAGPDGDYDEVVSKQSRDKKRHAHEDGGPYPMREDGRPILCHNCQKGDGTPQELMPCSCCPLWWHLHCLDPPAAYPPNRKTWQCPAHSADVAAEAHPLAPAHRFRKLKGAQVITPALGRGLKNNGQIELDWGDEPEPSHTGWPDPRSFGRTYKLPVNGVILDFIEQMRHQGAGYGPRLEEPKWLPTKVLPSPNSDAPLKGSALDRQLQEMQVSLTLTSLQRDRSGGTEKLTSALLNAVDPNVLALMAKTNADNIEFGKLSEDDRLGLRTMMLQMDAISARIRQTLGEDSKSAASALASPGATSVAEVTPMSSPREKMQTILPINEPTPPPTIEQGDGSMELD